MWATPIALSYCQADRAIGEMIFTALSLDGGDVWRGPADDRESELTEAEYNQLWTRRVFIVVLSPAALATPLMFARLKTIARVLARSSVCVPIAVIVAPITPDVEQGELLAGFDIVVAPADTRQGLESTVVRLASRLATAPPHGKDPYPLPTGAPMSDLLVLGHILLAQGRYADACACYAAVVKHDDRAVVAWYGIGLALNSLDQYDAALSAIDRALDLDPQFQGAWQVKSILLANLARFDEALAAADRVMDLDAYAGAYINKGYILLAMERYAETLEVADRALEFGSMPLTRVLRGSALLGLDRASEALAEADSALAADPTLPNALHLRFAALSKLGSTWGAPLAGTALAPPPRPAAENKRRARRLAIALIALMLLFCVLVILGVMRIVATG